MIWQNLFKKGSRANATCFDSDKCFVINVWSRFILDFSDSSFERITYDTILAHVYEFPKCKYLSMVSFPIWVFTSQTLIMNLWIVSANGSYFINKDKFIKLFLNNFTFSSSLNIFFNDYLWRYDEIFLMKDNIFSISVWDFI